ncbi:Crp/Fnr family transcriptional regulator [Pseudalkalibacillus sp. A8]|uniref:Crp/Fnr family transcriptional regulator n=1 Tax=Pseudalkalibacillus sp. A8 TaxID=3382641 RepID=UPI0038B5A208
MELRYSWKPYLDFGQKLEIEKDTYIYHQQDEGKGFYYLSEGKIRISISFPEGIERTINYVPTGMLFGEHGLYNEPYLTTACTVSSCNIYFFSNSVFKQICNAFPDATLLFTKSLLFKFRTLAEVVSFTGSPVEQQIAHFLIKLVSENGGNISLNQSALATYIGVSRISVNKILNRWKTNGIVNIVDNNLQIKDLQRLKEIQSLNTALPYNLDYLLLSEDLNEKGL